MLSTRSAQFSERARRVLPSGASRLSTAQEPYPLFADYGSGCRVTDVDGVERVDFVNNHSTLVLGHSHPVITRVVTEQMNRGTCFAMPTLSEITLAEKMCSRVESVQKIRFMNSASEAVAVALRAVRAFSGRQMIAKIEGGYHGQVDLLEVSLGSTPENWGDSVPLATSYSCGTSPTSLSQVVPLRYNNIENSLSALHSHRHELAALFIELLPIRCGMIMADEEYIDAIGDFCRQNGILLVYDETMSFRLSPGGAQSRYKQSPDLTIFGKMLGGGLPIGALGGSNEIMSVFESDSRNFVAHGGALAGNPISMVAASATLDLLNAETIDSLNASGNYARAHLSDVVKRTVGGQVTGAGSFFRIHLHSNPIREYRSVQLAGESVRVNRVHHALLDRGFIVSNSLSGNLSTAVSEVEIDGLCAALAGVLSAMPANP